CARWLYYGYDGSFDYW
nr:immunoglobulin heavy chain junction region [Mus musculus]